MDGLKGRRKCLKAKWIISRSGENYGIVKMKSPSLTVTPMARKTNEKKLEVLDRVLHFVMLGITEPRKILRLVPDISDHKTAKKYIEISQQKIVDMQKDEDREKILRRQRASIATLRERAAMDMEIADNSSARVGALNTFLHLLEREATLLGISAPAELLIGDKRGEGDDLAEILKALSPKDAKAIVTKLNEGRRKLVSSQ